MKKEKILLFILAVVQFSHILDFMIIMPLGSQLMRVFEITPQQFSLIVSSYAISAFAVGAVSALFIDRFDRKQALFWAFVGFTLGTVACAFAPSYYLFLAARSLTGVFGGILGTLVLAIVGDAIPIERRGTAMGVVMTAFSAASVVGVPIGLFLAAKFDWRMPFFVVAGVGVILTAMIHFYVPSLRKHLDSGKVQRNPAKVFTNIAQDKNQLKALLFTLLMMLGHFTIIPFIAPYMTLNVGFSEIEISYIYFVGGIFTFFTLPMFGRISDKLGHKKVFMVMGSLAVIPIFLITNLPPVAIPIALMVTSLFFVVASGRVVPATTMVTAVVKAESRGSFMSMRTSINELALALASLIAGAIVTKNTAGQLENYEYVGYIAIAMSLIAVYLGSQLIEVTEDEVAIQPEIEAVEEEEVTVGI